MACLIEFLKISFRSKIIYENIIEVTERVLKNQSIEQQYKLIEQQKEQLDERLEKKLEKLNTQLISILENLSEGVIVADNKGKIIMVNSEAKRLVYQLEKATTLGDALRNTKLFDMKGNEIPFENFPKIKALRGERVKNVKVFVGDINKEYFMEISSIPIYNMNGDLTMVVSCFHEITETIENQRLIENHQEQMVEIEKKEIEILKKEIEMKDEFLSLISHEFKTPLTVINAAIQAMELICKNELSDKAKGFLNKIRQNSNRQLKLVNNLLDITSMNAGHLKVNKINTEIVLLTRSITESITIYAELKNINLSFSSTLEKKVVAIDEEKYERIFLNLLSNAIKFTPKGKSITVKVSQKIIKGRCNVCIQVRDEGIGIPQDKQELIFERFGQVDSSLSKQAEGTGIGLHLVKMLVEILGGEITLESKEGEGSTFTFMLPIAKVKETPLEEIIQEISDKRLIKATAIEFSNVYF